MASKPIEPKAYCLSSTPPTQRYLFASKTAAGIIHKEYQEAETSMMLWHLIPLYAREQIVEECCEELQQQIGCCECRNHIIKCDTCVAWAEAIAALRELKGGSGGWV